MEPYWAGQGITLYHADMNDVLPILKPNQFEWVITDPPYGVNKGDQEWDGKFGPDWYKLHSHTSVGMAVMPGTRNLWICGDPPTNFKYRWTLATRIDNGMTRSDVGFANWIPTVIYTRDSVKLNFQQQDSVSISIRGKKPDHPSPKPIEHMSWLLSMLPGRTFIDPYGGSGTTALAAIMHGWKGVVIEREKEYCDLIVQRLSQQHISWEE